MKPRIGIIPGDPSGIGPELVAKLLAKPDIADRAHILLIGDKHVFVRGQDQAGIPFSMVPCDAGRVDWTGYSHFALHAMDTIDPHEIEIAEVTRAGGASVLKTLDKALDFARSGIIDAITFCPLNKAAMHAAELGHSDELHYMAEYLEVENYICELNTLDGIWTSRVTSHIALREVADTISSDRICEAVELVDRTLKRSGIKRPRLSVAALNPHAGDGGNFGMEEIEVIAPAIEVLAARQVTVDGPWPSDTVFLKAKAGEVDGIVTMYHDQGQIALKLMGFGRGVTVQGGMPFPVTTPAHGTAFDIAGEGKAEVGATLAAFEIACDMVNNWE